MKKIISLSAVIIALALIITMFAACGDKTEGDTTVPVASDMDAAVDVNVAGFTVEIGDTQAIVKKDGKEFQTLKYPSNPNFSFDKTYAQAHNEFLDMNFDGQPDFYIAASSVDGVIHYYCWLYNATTNQFDYSIILSALKNISVDAANHRILSTVNSDGTTAVISYHWVDGDLVLEKKYDNSTVPEEITKVVEENAIGVDKTTSTSTENNKTTTKVNSADKNNTTSTTKANKPANTTTTKVNNSGVMLGTGDMDEGWY